MSVISLNSAVLTVRGRESSGVWVTHVKRERTAVVLKSVKVAFVYDSVLGRSCVDKGEVASLGV